MTDRTKLIDAISTALAALEDGVPDEAKAILREALGQVAAPHTVTNWGLALSGQHPFLVVKPADATTH